MVVLSISCAWGLGFGAQLNSKLFLLVLCLNSGSVKSIQNYQLRATSLQTYLVGSWCYDSWRSLSIAITTEMQWWRDVMTLFSKRVIATRSTAVVLTQISSCNASSPVTTQDCRSAVETCYYDSRPLYFSFLRRLPDNKLKTFQQYRMVAISWKSFKHSRNAAALLFNVDLNECLTLIGKNLLEWFHIVLMYNPLSLNQTSQTCYSLSHILLQLISHELRVPLLAVF